MDEQNLRLLNIANEKTPFIPIYLTSVASSWFAEIIGYPFDVTKTRLQIQGEMASKTRAGVKNGMFATGYGIVKDEGFFKLYSGLSVMCLRHTIFTGLKMFFYDFFRTSLLMKNKEGNLELTPLRGSIAGLLSGACACFCSSPTDLIKVQMQMESKRRLMGEPPRIHSIQQAFMDIYRAGGIRGLWKGTIPNMQRASFVTLGDVSCYDLSKRYMTERMNMKDNKLTQFWAAMTAGFAGTILSCPADVVKSRIMNQPTDEKGRGLFYHGSVDCLIKLIQQEGIMAIYKGFTPYWLRIGPWTMVFWLAFEQIRIFTDRESF